MYIWCVWAWVHVCASVCVCVVSACTSVKQYTCINNLCLLEFTIILLYWLIVQEISWFGPLSLACTIDSTCSSTTMRLLMIGRASDLNICVSVTTIYQWCVSSVLLINCRLLSLFFQIKESCAACMCHQREEICNQLCSIHNTTWLLFLFVGSQLQAGKGSDAGTPYCWLSCWAASHSRSGKGNFLAYHKLDCG